MPRSYEADEKTFQKLRAAGKTSWDEQADPNATFDTFIMRPFLEESLAAISGPLAGLRVLEIGCGSGPVSCFLAAKGMSVRGIDVSPTALEMARENASRRGLSVRFESADICRMCEQGERSEQGGHSAQAGRYDLIVDGHCLHYFVLDEHRRAALSAVRRMLKPGGLFLIETMISHAGLVVGPSYRIDDRGVLSIKCDDDPAAHDAAFPCGPDWFAPYRRLLTADQLLTELRTADFTIHWHRAIEQKDPRKPMLMQLRVGIKEVEVQ